MTYESKLALALVEVGLSAQKSEDVVDALNEEISKVAKNHVLDAVAPLEARINEKFARLESMFKGAGILFAILVSIITISITVLTFVGKIKIV